MIQNHFHTNLDVSLACCRLYKPVETFFIGVQYHPELKSTVERPAPLFVSFIAAAKKYNETKSNLISSLLQKETV